MLSETTVNILIAVMSIMGGIIIGFVIAYWVQRKMQARELKIKRAVEIFTPLHKDIEEKIRHLSNFASSPMLTEIFEQTRSDYLFLASKDKIRKKIEDFYQRVSEYNDFLKRIRWIVQGIIAREMYDTHVSCVVEAPDSLDAVRKGKTVYGHYFEEAASFLDATIFIALKNDSPNTITRSEYGRLETPLYEGLSKSSPFPNLGDPEKIDQAIWAEAQKFSHLIFTRIYNENLLAKVKDRRGTLVETAKELKKYLSFRIQEITLD